MQSLIILGVAVLLGLLAVFLASRLVTPPSAPAQAQPVAGLTKIVVASAPIAMGAPINQALLKQIDWPSDAIPTGAFTSLADLVDVAEPRVALRPIEANEPVLASRVTGKGGRFSVSSLIDPAKRAATIRVNDVAGVGGFILPGDKVDVLITRPLPDDSNRTITDILLQNVPVLGLDQEVDEKREKPTVVKAATLEVSQLAAQKLALAQQVGSLSLALRSISGTETTPEPVRTVSLADLRDDATVRPLPARPVYRPRPAVPSMGATVTIVRGLKPNNYTVGHYAAN